MTEKGGASSEGEELQYVKSQRKYYRTKATKLCNNIESNYANLSLQDKFQLKDDLNDVKDKLNFYNNNVSKLLWKVMRTEDEIFDEMKMCDSYDDKLLQLIRRLGETTSSAVPTQSVSAGNSSNVSVSTQLKLPQIPLPEFSNAKGEALEQFIAAFESVVVKYNLNQFEKFVFLERQLRNEPLMLIKSLSSDDRSYDVARELLFKAFGSATNLKFDIIKRLVNLKLYNNGEPYKFISEMRVIIDTFKSLKVDIDTVLQFFIWNGLNEQFRNILISITNETKPELDMIVDNIFKATERYLSTVSLTKSKYCDSAENLNCMAVNIERKNDGKLVASNSFSAKPFTKFDKSEHINFRKCSLCVSDKVSNIDHAIFKCNVYDSPLKKVNKLKSIHGCIKCGIDNHQSKDCKYRFKRSCRTCDKMHFDYLCLQDRSKISVNSCSTSNTGGEIETNDTVVHGSLILNSFNVNFKNSKDVIIPTFTCKLWNGNILRGMKDSGAQFSFISESAVNANKFKLIEKDLTVNINGVNSCKKLNTKVVEIKADFGTGIIPFYAIVVPEVPTVVKIPGLTSVVSEYRRRGFSLADGKLGESDIVEHLDFVLGSNAFYCLPEKSVVFGEFPFSCYSETKIGIILYGSIEPLKLNLKFLPLNTSFLQCAVTSHSESFLISESDDNHNSLVSTCSERDSPCGFDICINHVVLDDLGKIIQNKLNRISEEALVGEVHPYINEKCKQILEYEEVQETLISEQNFELIDSTLAAVERLPNGRLVMPLSWNDDVKHLLGQNYLLSRQILLSNLRKLNKDPDSLFKIDEVFNEQLKSGIIEKIPNLDVFLSEHPEACFLAHMPVFKHDRETTKVRVVYLSNLSGSDPNKPVTLSNNQCMFAGPCLNSKISTSLLNLRFGKYLLCFDLVKAFLQIVLKPHDSLKLCFLWFDNIKNNNFKIVAYKSIRLPFGLKCSPFLLMLGLYKILVIDTEGDDEGLKALKSLLYANFYMDNGAITSDSIDYLSWAYAQLPNIFDPYGFSLQQVHTNCDAVEFNEISIDPSVKLLGMKWNKECDKISTSALKLNIDATTKREMLSSLASNYDIYNINGPLLNRARLFIHKLQCQSDLGWDAALPKDLLRSWRNIAKQVNAAPSISIDRHVGSRDDPYCLVSFVDSSKTIVGTVLYLYNLKSRSLKFLCAKNKIVGKSLEDRSIPALELTAVNLGVESMMDTYFELTGKFSVLPVKIEKCLLFSDSSICINWLYMHTVKLDKMRNKSVYVMNRLSAISKLCVTFPVEFRFCAGKENPADCITRELSYKQLVKSNFHSGPKFIHTDGLKANPDEMTITIPNPTLQERLRETGDSSPSVDVGSTLLDVQQSVLHSSDDAKTTVSFPIEYSKYSSFSKIINVTNNVLTFINKLKSQLKQKDPGKYSHFEIIPNVHSHALNVILRLEQNKYFPEVFNYFQNPTQRCNVPSLVLQFNLFLDSDGLIRVKSKFGRWQTKKCFPVFLPKTSFITSKLIEYFHCQLSHASIYTVLNELRRQFFIQSVFSTVKKVIKCCITCRKFNNKPMKLNQSAYRDFRADPPRVPFRTIFIDFIGPFNIKNPKHNSKVYLLCISCLWSRAVNIKICRDLTVQQFLRAFQLHCFEFGVPETCHSDLGSQIVAASNLISDFLNDEKTKSYFNSIGMNPLTFKQFPKGHKELGGIVESMVKIVKKLIYSSIGRNVLSLEDFEFLIYQTLNIINKRPIAFKESLRGNTEVPCPITPEMVTRGYELPSVNLIPELHKTNIDSDWTNLTSSKFENQYNSLSKVRNNLIRIYNNEFFGTLVAQATNEKGRYIPINHKSMDVGDIVLIRDECCKHINFPLGIVRKINTNFLGEVTDVEVFKGATREVVKRHSASLVPILKVTEYSNTPLVLADSVPSSIIEAVPERRKCTRSAAVASINKIRNLHRQGMV